MKTSTDWFIYGTFELVNSTLFKQVWVIVCPINNYSSSIPCAFLLLPCKEYTAYKMVMDCILSNDIPVLRRSISILRLKGSSKTGDYFNTPSRNFKTTLRLS